MANRKHSGRPPQAQHAAKSKSSQHDKRQRLAKPNPKRQSTDAASVPLVDGIAMLAIAMSRLLDKRIAFRLPITIAGALLAGGRRTAASWFAARALKTIGIASMNCFSPSAGRVHR